MDNIAYIQFKKAYSKLMQKKKEEKNESVDHFLKDIYSKLDELTFEIYDFLDSTTSDCVTETALYEINKHKAIYPQLCQAMVLLSLQLSIDYDAQFQDNQASSSVSTSSSSSASGSTSSSSSISTSSSSPSSSSTNAY